jgi:hypothetical protein
LPLKATPPLKPGLERNLLHGYSLSQLNKQFRDLFRINPRLLHTPHIY